jgi:hypothetical protein
MHDTTTALAQAPPEALSLTSGAPHTQPPPARPDACAVTRTGARSWSSPPPVASTAHGTSPNCATQRILLQRARSRQNRLSNHKTTAPTAHAHHRHDPRIRHKRRDWVIGPPELRSSASSASRSGCPRSTSSRPVRTTRPWPRRCGSRRGRSSDGEQLGRQRVAATRRRASAGRTTATCRPPRTNGSGPR